MPVCVCSVSWEDAGTEEGIVLPEEPGEGKTEVYSPPEGKGESRYICARTAVQGHTRRRTAGDG